MKSSYRKIHTLGQRATSNEKHNPFIFDTKRIDAIEVSKGWQRASLPLLIEHSYTWIHTVQTHRLSLKRVPV